MLKQRWRRLRSENDCHDWLECYCRVDNFVFEQAPRAVCFGRRCKNCSTQTLKLLKCGAATSEAAGRDVDDRRQTLDKLRGLQRHADDMVEQGSSQSRSLC
jgi:hypothetical protein